MKHEALKAILLFCHQICILFVGTNGLIMPALEKNGILDMLRMRRVVPDNETNPCSHPGVSCKMIDAVSHVTQMYGELILSHFFICLQAAYVKLTLFYRNWWGKGVQGTIPTSIGHLTYMYQM
jgi:hypothetical protein